MHPHEYEQTFRYNQIPIDKYSKETSVFAKRRIVVQQTWSDVTQAVITKCIVLSHGAEIICWIDKAACSHIVETRSKGFNFTAETTIFRSLQRL